MVRSILLVAWPFIALGTGAPLWAAEAGRPPVEHAVAIVEEVEGGGDIKRLDLLRDGDILELGDNGRVVLSYLQSCWQDAVRRGRVLVGGQQSRVERGSVVRRRVECDPPGNMALLAGKASAKQNSTGTTGASPEPAITLFGRSPIVLLPGSGQTLVIERLDGPATPFRTDVTGDRVDLADLEVMLAVNALYRATSGAADIVFRIDILAERGRAPAAGRLLVLR